MSGIPNPDHFLTLAEIAASLRVSTKTARRFILQHKEELGTQKIGKEYRVPKKRFDRFTNITN